MLDLTNAEDLIIVACDILSENPIYERCILNPENFQLLVTLEHAKAYFPESVRIKTYMMKVYAKLGCSKRVLKIAKTIPLSPDTEVYLPKKDYEKLSAIKYSLSAKWHSPSIRAASATKGCFSG